MLDVDVRGLEEKGVADSLTFAKAVAKRAKELGVLLAWADDRRGSHLGVGGKGILRRALDASLYSGKPWDEALAEEARKQGGTAIIQVFDSFSIGVIVLRGAEPALEGSCPRCGAKMLSLRVGHQLFHAACPGCGLGVEE